MTSRLQGHTRATPRSIAGEGVKDMAGLAVGYVPFAITIGAVISSTQLNPFSGWAGGPIIAAGTAHLTLIELLAGATGLLTAVAAALVINIRLVAYGAGLAPWFSEESTRWRLLLSWLVIDPTYLLAVDRFERDDPGVELRRFYFLGLALVLYPVWCLGIGLGVVAGAVIPAGLELTKAAPLMMVGLLAKSLDESRGRRSVAIGLTLGVVGLGLANHTMMLVAAVLAFATACVGSEEGS